MRTKKFVGIWWEKPGNARFYKTTLVLSIKATSTSDAERKFKQECETPPSLVLTEREASSLMQKLKKTLK